MFAVLIAVGGVGLTEGSGGTGVGCVAGAGDTGVGGGRLSRLLTAAQPRGASAHGRCKSNVESELSKFSASSSDAKP